MDERQVSQLVQKVQSNKKYQPITPELVHHLAQDALRRGLRGKPAIKDVRNKLHQIGGAYFRRPPDYEGLQESLKELPKDKDSKALHQFCQAAMQAHASTAERLPILEEFFATCLAPIAPVTSVIDLACGLNPLAVPWMPLASNVTYFACDIYLDMLALVQKFFEHIELKGQAKSCDLTGELPKPKTQLALLLKTLPCLEQVDKSIGRHLLRSIQADYLLVSFPVHSLGGRRKGMPDFYRQHFFEMLSGLEWQVQEFNFSTELAFLVTK